MKWKVVHKKYADYNGRLIEKWTVTGSENRQFDTDNEKDACWLRDALNAVLKVTAPPKET